MAAQKTIGSYIVDISISNEVFPGKIEIIEIDGEHFIRLVDDVDRTRVSKAELKRMAMFGSHGNGSYGNASYIVRIDDAEFMYKVIFDNNSSSSYDNFRNTVEKLTNTKQIQQFYPSGNIQIVGCSVKDKLDGFGTEYFDGSDNIKYQGEFEDDKYDGEGEFYSKDRLIRVHVNNISSGKPIDYGKIYINELGLDHVINFGEMMYFNLDLGKEDFCYELARIIWPDIKSMLFKKLDIQEQIYLIWDKLQSIDLDLGEIKKKEVDKGILNKFWQ